MSLGFLGYRPDAIGGEPIERFAADLKALRAERGWSQEDLSRALAYTRPRFLKIESANRAPRFPTIVILAEAFNVPAGRLFDRIP